ncbi:response regulator [Amphiplicatus metriothermophilus]|uniref:response regulator n=1 Tax=Amphiplicatus metriothermophilus TaxID=1519374 RepID=UPI00135A33FA|nr:response regulator [Amphiplicatus metriothermophilus]MBB5517601.1 two-component system cell cycle sensor histidine kinase/response regulator CckA [Amphiplicatus metriothermophilus]
MAESSAALKRKIARVARARANAPAAGPSGDGPSAPAAAPRPASPAEIARLLDEAAAQEDARRRVRPGPAPGAVEAVPVGDARPERWQLVTFALLWTGLAAGFAAGVWLGYVGAGLIGASLAAAFGFALLLAAGAALNQHAPALLAGAMLRRAAGRGGAEAARLAGADMLAALGLAEKTLDADPDARLVTRRDGVVVYANAAYLALAREAGVIGPAGLPPRIDRLFAQQGPEATKLFRLCRAAKSAAAAEEIIHQLIGVKGGGARRRFEVSVRPIPGAEDYVAWRLRELPLEENQHDALAAAYADFPRPVLALERSGQIAWANAALRERLGAGRGASAHIDELVLGETADLVRALWRVDQSPQKARLRGPGGEPADGTFCAFRRGGVGEGFVCVELALEEEKEKEETVSVSGDIAEAPFGVAVVEGEFGRDARIVEANRAFTEVFGGAKKNAPLSRSFPPESLEELAAEIRRRAASGGAPKPVEVTLGAGAAARAFAVYARPVRRRRGGYGARRTMLYSVDVTDRKRMQDEHAQDQKLKAIGRLAGEVAHDFNNLLQVVLGNCERLMLRHPAGDPAYRDLVLIRENAQRAANMTKQLLAFSRKQTLKREVLSITEILRDFARFLDRAIGEKVKLELVNGRGLPLIRVDRNQLETAIMNLAVNARDAMGAAGGVLTIRTRLVPAAEIETLGLAGLAAQDHLLIEVADTGPGVPREIADKIFDPFFTTKEEGKGTGLGLSTVHGIIGQMDGAIVLGENDGPGAVFRIYLPAHQGEPEIEATAAAGHMDLTGAGRVLVVEDEDAVRNFVVAALEDCGYEITAVGDGEEALDVIAEEAGAFDLLITDVMMPAMDGPTLVEHARADLGLKAKVIFMSAYAEAALREQLDAIEEAGYIQKPFTLKGLAAKVKETLAGEAAVEA